VRSPLLNVLPSAGGTKGASNLVAALLREQQTLTAVERFADRHDAGDVPAQAKYYRELLPTTRPRTGQQYAFEVDLDVCTGCKACVAGCHSMNGLDEIEIWRTVGLLHGGTAQAPVQQTVTTSCHHCVDPACLSGCPVKAYEKDPVTGIVKHLDDQCIGCQYCTLMCPYDAPKYSPARGIVRKCDMCSDRLAVGEAPACVQACPNGAIKIKVVDQVQAIQTARTAAFLPGAPAADHTLPTTVYKSSRPAPAGPFIPADFYAVAPEHAHLPLVVTLVFTQLAAGAYVVNQLAQRFLGATDHPLAQAVVAVALACAALGASLFHLGRPQWAFRAFLGWRTSWLSREIIGFGAFAKLGIVHAAALALPMVPTWPVPGRGALTALTGPLGVLVAVVGLASVGCSVGVYVATRRAHWALVPTTLKFIGTTLVLGTSATLAVSVATARVFAHVPAGFRTLLVALALVTTAKLGFEALGLRHRRDREHTVKRRIAVLMTGDLSWLTAGRHFTGLAGGVILPLALLAHGHTADVPGVGTTVATVAAFLLLILGELGERALFFTAAPPSRMPGALS
jgi:Fe-S-cluster-containing dehydrogenase component/DMSO reductase anchor subunit